MSRRLRILAPSGEAAIGMGLAPCRSCRVSGRLVSNMQHKSRESAKAADSPEHTPKWQGLPLGNRHHPVTAKMTGGASAQRCLAPMGDSGGLAGKNRLFCENFQTPPVRRFWLGPRKKHTFLRNWVSFGFVFVGRCLLGKFRQPSVLLRIAAHVQEITLAIQHVITFSLT